MALIPLVPGGGVATAVIGEERDERRSDNRNVAREASVNIARRLINTRTSSLVRSTSDSFERRAIEFEGPPGNFEVI